ncbi:ferritin-like domain-containing protein [Pseudoxanthomonas helianthi]|uniref:Ferritin-like domain-containing protein n=1 Tax=Pseudoxanthomonas helianthi TaxID=1453541 RepID=A0A940WZB5_9GAMM|nr:ferritin-like domain-containing protein [Pseudoxanthomonas helianthi]MBP3983405.1 ferritin-like domain-containing protein [Pseudoxanthomonas helianthi]
MISRSSDRLVAWLRQAYVMEREAEAMLSVQVRRIDHYPILARRLQQHLYETQEQARKLEACLARHGASVPSVKGATASFMAAMHAACNTLVSDEVMRDVVVDYAFEHMEVAIYETLVVAAEAAEDLETRAVCLEIFEQERTMASWLVEHLESTARQFLDMEQSEVEAKR